MTDNHRHLGFTFIELFAATAICAILTIAVTAVIGATSQPPSQASDAPTFDVLDATGEQLRWDLTHAHYAKFNNNTLTLQGYGSIYKQTLEPNHRPTQVKYYFQTTDDSNWLVREQRDLDVITNENTTRQLVLTGLDQILIQVLSQPTPVNFDQPPDDDQQDDESNSEKDAEDNKENPQVAERDDGNIKWLDLKQDNKWFVTPDVIKFVFVPVEAEEVELTYDGYDSIQDYKNDQPAYPQKVLILR